MCNNEINCNSLSQSVRESESESVGLDGISIDADESIYRGNSSSAQSSADSSSNSDDDDAW